MSSHIHGITNSNNLNMFMLDQVYSSKAEKDVVLTKILDILNNGPDNPNYNLALRKIHVYNQSMNSFISKLSFLLSGNWSQYKELKNIDEKISVDLQRSPPKLVESIENSAQAYDRFMLNFETSLKTKPKPATAPERKLISEISDRIWNSANVQEKPNPDEKYHEYEKLMIIYYKGGHFNFEEGQNENITDLLKNKISYIDNPQDLGRQQLAPRVSSHFVKKVGEVMHVHLAGQQIPETVFGEVELAVRDNKPIPGIRHDMGETTLPSKKYFWIQTENNPDGPDWGSYLKHRTVDFVIYNFRKLMKYENVNVGPYGYGPGDKNPVFIRKAAEQNSLIS